MTDRVIIDTCIWASVAGSSVQCIEDRGQLLTDLIPSAHTGNSAHWIGRLCCKQPLRTFDQPAFEVAGFGVEGGAD